MPVGFQEQNALTDTKMTTAARPEKRGRRHAESPAAAGIGISDDILVTHVFLRLPVESLVRVRLVCRSWHAAVEEPGFVRRHLELSRARRPPSLLVVPRADDADEGSVSDGVSFHRLVLDEARTPETADVALVFEKEGVAMTNAVLPTHCDGLVALATATGQVFVCNPETREFVALLPGSRDVRGSKAPPAAAIAYDALRNRYVVARYFYREHRQFSDAGKDWLEFDIGHEVFTLGGGDDDGVWEPTADPPHAIGPARPICTREAIYWCTDYLRPNALLRFGLRDRAFDAVPFPPGMDFHHAGSHHMTELSGKLCCVHTATVTAFDVWVADDGGPQPDWALRCRVDFDDFGPGVGAEALLPVAAAGDEMLMVADYRTLYSYDARRGGVAKVVDMEEELAYERADGSELPNSCGLVHHVVPYVESLVPIRNRTMPKPG